MIESNFTIIYIRIAVFEIGTPLHYISLIVDNDYSYRVFMKYGAKLEGISWNILRILSPLVIFVSKIKGVKKFRNVKFLNPQNLFRMRNTRIPDYHFYSLTAEMVHPLIACSMTGFFL